MRIEGPGAGNATDKTKRTQRGNGAAPGQFARTLGAMAGGDDAAPPVAGAGAATGVEALLAAQDVTDESPGGRHRQAYARGREQLDALQQMHRRLVAGALSESELEALARASSEPRPSVRDPGLSQVLDEIDVRVQVELAKRRAAR